MAILLTQTSSDDRWELVIRNRQVGFAVAAGAFAILTGATFVSAWLNAAEWYSLALNGVTTLLFAYFTLYFSVLRTRIVIDARELRIRYAGLVGDIGDVRIPREDLASSTFALVDHPLTGNKLASWTLVRRDGRRKVLALSLPRLQASQVIETLKSTLA